MRRLQQRQDLAPKASTTQPRVDDADDAAAAIASKKRPRVDAPADVEEAEVDGDVVERTIVDALTHRQQESTSVTTRVQELWSLVVSMGSITRPRFWRFLNHVLAENATWLSLTQDKKQVVIRPWAIK